MIIFSCFQSSFEAEDDVQPYMAEKNSTTLLVEVGGFAASVAIMMVGCSSNGVVIRIVYYVFHITVMMVCTICRSYLCNVTKMLKYFHSISTVLQVLPK